MERKDGSRAGRAAYARATLRTLAVMADPRASLADRLRAAEEEEAAARAAGAGGGDQAKRMIY